MDDLRKRLRDLGAAVADVSDRDADGGTVEALARARNAFVAGVARPPARRSPWMPALAAAACIALAGAGVVVRRHVTASAQPPAPISFSVGAAALPGVVGEWVAADAAMPLQTRFSDGSALALSPGARMRVTTTNPTGADILIERGNVHAAVAHPAGAAARWAVRAGPFEVRVTGTTFDAAWDPMSETFVLTMIEGRVVVTGPSIPPDRTVVGGERLVVSVRDARMVLSTGAAEPSVTMGGDPPYPPLRAAAADRPTVTVGPSAGTNAVGGDPPYPSSRPVADPPRPVPRVIEAGPMGGDPSGRQASPAPPTASAIVEAAPSGDPVGGPAPTWKELAAKGKYRDAFTAAEAAGFSQEIERAPAGDLLMLADAARFSGSPAKARDALHAARRRFGMRGKTAFLLGKIAADQQGSPGDAVSWFEVYLREEPGGPLAEQALGRILDLSRRSSPEAARRAAVRYLARYPDGSYAALARSLVADRPPGDPPSPPPRAQ